MLLRWLLLFVFSCFFIVEVENEEVDAENSMRLSILNKKLENVGIGSGDWNPGQYHGLICPMV